MGILLFRQNLIHRIAIELRLWLGFRFGLELGLGQVFGERVFRRNGR